MKTFILGGVSTKNHLWAKELAQLITEQRGYPSDFQVYQHWITTGDDCIDFEGEKEHFLSNVDQLGEDFSLICKSIGIILFLKSIDVFKVLPKQVILCGINLNLLQRFHTEVRNFPFPVVLLQNPGDPAGNFQDIFEELSQNVDWKIFEGIGDTHAYDSTLILKHLM